MRQLLPPFTVSLPGSAQQPVPDPALRERSVGFWRGAGARGTARRSSARMTCPAGCPALPPPPPPPPLMVAVMMPAPLRAGPAPAPAWARRSMHQGCLLNPRNSVFYPFFTHFPPFFAHFQRLDARNPGSTAKSPGENGKKSEKNRGK